MNEILQLFQYEFFQNAIWASILVSLLSGIIGTYIVTKRIVFISGGITHASFGGIGIGFFLGINPLLGAVIFAVLSALGIEYLSIHKKMRYDTLIGIFWSLGMSLGIVFMSLTPGYVPNLMSYLFGNILTISSDEIMVMLILTLIVGLFSLYFFKPILFIAYNEDFAATRIKYVNFFKYIMIVLTALVMVLSIRVIGVILVISLLTLPQTTANIITKKYASILLLSVIIAFAGMFFGLILSYFYEIPSGATIIVVLFIIFILIKSFDYLLSKIRQI